MLLSSTDYSKKRDVAYVMSEDRKAGDNYGNDNDPKDFGSCGRS